VFNAPSTKAIEFQYDWFGNDYGQRASAILSFIRSLSGFSGTALGYDTENSNSADIMI